MITAKKVFVMSMAFFGAYCAAYARTDAPAALSQYGQIQAVKNYSSNPYWNPNGPYNQKSIPKAIYVDGADLTTKDCNTIVGNLVASFCALNNNCSNMRLADVRPTIMVQLSQLPGHNYATSCSGYIDAAFSKYESGAVTLNLVKNTSTTANTINLQNPYAPKLNAYQAGVLERTKELEQLQAQTGTSAQINSADFPKTVADLSLTDRMANATEGYEPYKDKSAYKIPNFETEEDFNKRLKTQNLDEYCTRFPNDADCKCALNPEDPACKTTPTPNPNPNPTPSQCPDPKYMDSDCKCTVPNSKQNPLSLKCECTNGGNINNNCNNQQYNEVPKCITNLTATDLQTNILNLLNGRAATKDNIESTRGILDIIYFYILQNCFNTPENLERLNYFIERYDSLPISISGNILDIDSETVFSVSNKIYYPIIITDTNLQMLSKITNTQVNVNVTDQNTCAGLDTGGYTNKTPSSALTKRASGKWGNFGKGFYNLATQKTWNYKTVFPGAILAYTAGFSNYKKHHFPENNYVKARRDMYIWAYLSKYCKSDRLAAYLIEHDPDTKATQATVMSEPFKLY